MGQGKPAGAGLSTAAQATTDAHRTQPGLRVLACCGRLNWSFSSSALDLAPVAVVLVAAVLAWLAGVCAFSSAVATPRVSGGMALGGTVCVAAAGGGAKLTWCCGRDSRPACIAEMLCRCFYHVSECVQARSLVPPLWRGVASCGENQRIRERAGNRIIVRKTATEHSEMSARENRENPMTWLFGGAGDRWSFPCVFCFTPPPFPTYIKMAEPSAASRLPLTTADALHTREYSWRLRDVHWGDVLRYQVCVHISAHTHTPQFAAAADSTHLATPNELLPCCSGLTRNTALGRHPDTCASRRHHRCVFLPKSAACLRWPCTDCVCDPTHCRVPCAAAAVSHWTFQERPVVRQALLYDATIRCVPKARPQPDP